MVFSSDILYGVGWRVPGAVCEVFPRRSPTDRTRAEKAHWRMGERKLEDKAVGRFLTVFWMR